MNEKAKVEKKTSLKFDPQIYRRVRIRAIEEGRTVSSIMNDAVAAYLKQPIKRAGKGHR